MDSNQFREKVQAYRRPTGHSQQELAEALGIQRQVLARKFSGSNNAHFTHGEIKQIVKTLAEWEAINTRGEAIELLTLMDLRPVAFSPTEWDTSPLADLEKDEGRVVRTQPVETRPQPLSQPPAAQLPTPLTGLIGREWLIKLAVERLLKEDVRLLTLVGPGGIGKTRLSLEIGRRLVEQYGSNLFFVDLSSLTDPAQFAPRLVQSLGLTATLADPTENLAVLQEYLADRQTLLILDNFEQILPAAETLGQLLRAAPGLRALVTSRVVLQIYGETELGVPPLELPDLANLPTPAALEQFEAIKLFVTRARAGQPAFALSPANFNEVARLCILLEGLPLSLELAAARVKLLPLPFLLQKLGESKLQILAGGGRALPARQQTLRATLDWSYSLLDETARRLFERLGIFRGSFNLTAVEQICFGPGETVPADLLDDLGALVDHSLLKTLVGAQAEPRFTMLETMREYAGQKLQQSEEFEAIQERYRLYYNRLVEDLSLDFYMDPEDRGGLSQLLEQDFDNFLATQLQSTTATEAEKETVNFQPVEVEGTILIERPVAEVFAYLARGENWPQWNHLIKECRAAEPGPPGTGTVYYVVSSLLGRRHQHKTVISEFVPNQFFEMETVSDSIKVIHRLSFTPEGSKTRFTFTMINGIGQVFRFTRPILTRIIQRGVDIQLVRLKAVLED